MTTPTQSDRVLEFLRANPGATALDIAHGCHPWVSNPRARISDLRDQLRLDGGDIVCERRPDGKNGYRVIETEPVQLAMALAESS